MIGLREYPGVSIGGKHCYRDLDLILTDVDIKLPDVQTSTTEVPGMDGVLDYTEVLTGHVRYKNRSITLTFATSNKFTKLDWSTFLSNLAGTLHGQKLRIIFDDDPEHYYVGRCTIDSFSTDWRNHTVKIVCDCDPWKYKTKETTVTITIPQDANTKFIIYNEQRNIVPTITLNEDTWLFWEDERQGTRKWELFAGTNREMDLELAAGANTYWARPITGTEPVTITFTYQEASL